MSILDKISKQIDTIDIEQDILYKKWSIQHREESFTQIYWSNFPMTQKYFFEGNPSFFYEYKNIFDLGRYPLVMLRDGFLGILDFFLKNPLPPKDFVGNIIIPEKFQSLTPKSWKGRVASYRFYNVKNERQKAEKLVVFGSPTAEVFHRRSIEQVIKDIASYTRKYEEKLILMPIRDSLLASEETKKEMHFIHFLKEFYRVEGFDEKIHFHDIDKLVKPLEGSFFDYYFFDEEKIFLNDNFLCHLLSSYGGKNLSWDELKPGGLNYQLSNFHGVQINELSTSENCFSDFYMNFRLKGVKNGNLPDLFQSEDVHKNYLKHFSKF